MNKQTRLTTIGFATGLAMFFTAIIGRAADINANWLFPTSGSWNDPTKWSSNPLFPKNGASTFNATIAAAGGAYSVSLGTDITIENLTINSANALLAHSGGILQINGGLTLQAGTYRLEGGAIKDATINQIGGLLIFGYHGGNRLDGATLDGDLNLNQAGGAFVRLQNGASFTGDAHVGTSTGNPAVLAYEQTGTIEGTTVHLDGAFSFTYLSIEGTNTLTLGATGTIRGHGSIGNQVIFGGPNALLNEGKISADLTGRTLSVQPASFTNSGIVEAINGATLNLSAGTWSNGALGTIRATGGSTLNFSGSYTNSGAIELSDSTLNLQGTFTVGALRLAGFSRSGASTVNIQGNLDNAGTTFALNATTGDWNLAGGRIIGGNITQSAGARLFFTNNGGNRLDGATFEGDLNLNQVGGAFVRLQNGASFTGEAHIGTPDGSGAGLAYEQSGTLEGTTVHLAGAFGSSTYLSIEGTNTLTLGATGTIRGHGSIGNQVIFGGPNALLNKGKISADLTGQTLKVQPASFTNSGIVEAINGATLSIPNGYTQTGGITRLNDGTINSLTINLVSGTLEGRGTVNADVVSSGVINLDVGGIISGDLVATGGSWNGQGTVAGPVTATVGAFTIGNGANLTAEGGLAITDTGTIVAGGPSATITGDVRYTAATQSTFSVVIAGEGKTLNLANGAATLTLAGANTYTGATTVNAGTLKAGIISVADTSGAFGKNSPIIMADSVDATLDIAGFNTQIGSLTGGGANGGDVVLGNAILIVGGDQTSPDPYAGAISGNGGVTKIGSGTQTFSGTNTYNGATTVNAGTLTLDFSDLAVPTNVLHNASALSLGGGTLSVLGKTGSGVVSSQTLSSLTLSANTLSTIIVDPNDSNTGRTTLTLGNVWSRQPGATLLIDYSSANTGTRFVKTSGPVMGSGAQANGVFAYVLVEDAGGIGFATQDGSFNVVRRTASGTVLTTSNSVAGTTNIDFTTVSTNPGYSSVGGTLTLNNVAHSANTLTIDSTGGGTLDLGAANGVLTLTSGGLLVRGNDDYTIEDGALRAAGNEVIVHQIASGNLTIKSPIGNGPGALTKDGDGVLTLTGFQNYLTLTTSGGTTNLEAPLGSGSSILNSNAITNISQSQTLQALNIGANGLVTLGNAGPASAEDLRLAGGSLASEDDFSSSSSLAVPEPHTCGLLGFGALLFSLRRKRTSRLLRV